MSSLELLLVDGMSLLFRAYYALIKKPMRTSSGFNTSGIFGYVNLLLDALDREQPMYNAVILDSEEPTFRHQLYSGYKAQRERAPEDLIGSIPYVIQITQALSIPILRMPGFEADDIIGTLAVKAAEQGMLVKILTPDKDLAQLVNDRIRLLCPKHGKEILEMGPEEVCREWEVRTPQQIVDLLGLMGDAVDNIPGVKGIGKVTATKLLHQYGSLEHVLEVADNLEGRIGKLLREQKENALLSKKLATIDTSVPLTVDFEQFKRQARNDNLFSRLCQELEFVTLYRRVTGKNLERDLFSLSMEDQGTSILSEGPQGPSGEMNSIQTVEHHYQIIDDPSSLASFFENLDNYPIFAFDLETDSLDEKVASLVGISFSWKEGEAIYIPLINKDHSPTSVQELVRQFLMKSKQIKVGHNLKYDLSVLRWRGWTISGPYQDTLLAHCLLDPGGKHTLDHLARVFFNYHSISYTELTHNHTHTLLELPVEQVAQYCCEDADVTFRLAHRLMPKIESEGLSSAFKLECDLIPVLIEMEYNGIRIDTDRLTSFSKELDRAIQETKEVIYGQVGFHFNLDSPKQLGEVLFDHLQVSKKPKKTPSGQYATNEQELIKLANRHPIVQDILVYRQLSKLQNTYAQKLPKMIFPKTGRIHANFNQITTSTGRISCDNPNLQNIPIRTPIGREIRKVFIPSQKNFKFISADYSQIELRIIAAFTRSEPLIAAFQAGEDIHRMTASHVFNVPSDQVSEEMRTRAKMVNYGLAYGMSAYGLAERLGISPSEAKEIMDRYFRAFPEIRTYMERTITQARQTGMVKTILGRRRYLPDINSQNRTVREAAERNAINMPIQGTAAELIKIAMVNLYQQLSTNLPHVKMLLQIHDELLFEAPEEVIGFAISCIRDTMEHAMDLGVPLTVDIGVGNNWEEAHK